MLAQDFDDWELIVSDNEPGNKNNIRYFSALDSHPNIRYVTCKQRGQVANLNHAISLAQGQWIKPLYDDDTLLPECLSAFAAALQALNAVPDAQVVLLTCLANQYQYGQCVRESITASVWDLGYRATKMSIMACMYKTLTLAFPHRFLFGMT